MYLHWRVDSDAGKKPLSRASKQDVAGVHGIWGTRPSLTFTVQIQNKNGKSALDIYIRGAMATLAEGVHDSEKIFGIGTEVLKGKMIL